MNQMYKCISSFSESVWSHSHEYMIKTEAEIMITRVTGDSSHPWMLTAEDIVNTRH
jgi:hypothetical protein